MSESPLAIASTNVFATATPASPIPVDELKAFEAEFQFRWPCGFREFLAAYGAGNLCGYEVLSPAHIRTRTEQIGKKMRAYGLKSAPESLNDAALNKSVIVVGKDLFCNPAAPGMLYRIHDDQIDEIGCTFADFAVWVREARGPSLKQLHFSPAVQAGRVTSVMRSKRRQHCFDAVEMMLTPADRADGEMLEYDGEGKTFLLGLTKLRGTISCSCQEDLHRIVVDYDAEADPEALAKVLTTLADLGYKDPADTTGTIPKDTGTIDATMAGASYKDERILAVLPDYSLEKRVDGDLVFTNRRLFFFYREGTVSDAVSCSLDQLLMERGRYEAYEYDDLKRLLLKRNLFGRSLVAVTPRNAGKNEYWGSKKLLPAALAIAPDLRDLGVPLHTVT